MVITLFLAGLGFVLASQYTWIDKKTGEKRELELPALIAVAIVFGLVGVAGQSLGVFCLNC